MWWFLKVVYVDVPENVYMVVIPSLSTLSTLNSFENACSSQGHNIVDIISVQYIFAPKENVVSLSVRVWIALQQWPFFNEINPTKCYCMAGIINCWSESLFRKSSIVCMISINFNSKFGIPYFKGFLPDNFSTKIVLFIRCT